jgi:hypothetical protein
MCSFLYDWIQSNGDTARGSWSVDPSGPWELYTDASSIALGSCLLINGAVVEDASWLRKVSDRRPIDLVELESVLVSFNKLLLPWLHVAGGNRKVIVRIDNKPVLGQLQRKQQAHWSSAKGLGSACAEIRLQLIEDLIQLKGLDVEFRYVPSCENLADCLTRIPSELMWKIEKLPRTVKVFSNFNIEVEDISDVENESVDWRVNSFIENKKRIFKNDALIPFLHEYHNKHHLAVSPMYDKLKVWVSADRLLPSIRAVVYGCEICQSSKACSFQNGDHGEHYSRQASAIFEEK